jgi:serine/threonine-protein kinase RsbW
MPRTDTAKFPGRFDSLPAIADLAGRAAEAAGMDSQTIYAVQLAVDEACSNIIEHAYGGEDVGEIECTFEVDSGGLRLVLHDHGRPFNPASIPEPDLVSQLESRKVGGLGLYLIRKIMDEVKFEFDGSGNTLTLVKHADPAA